MGTEFLVLFIPVPFVLWAWNLWQCRHPKRRRKNLLLLVLGLSFVAFMCLPLTTYGYLIQSLCFAGFFYAPLYLVAWFVLTLVLGEFRESKEPGNSNGYT